MNKSFNRKEWVFTFLVFTIFIISSISAISYLNSEGVFDAQISYINNEKFPYYLIVEVENKVDETLRLDLEVLYGKENLVLGSEDLSCNQEICEVKVLIKKVFYDELSLNIFSKYNGENYKKEINFILEKPKSNNKIIIPQSISVEPYVVPKLEGKLDLEENLSNVIIRTFPQNNPENKIEKIISCDKKCNFNFNLSKDLEFGKYLVQVYLPLDTISSSFVLYSKNQNQTFDKKVKNNTLKVSTSKNSIEIIDFQGKIQNISVRNKTILIDNVLGFTKDSEINDSFKAKISSKNQLNPKKEIEVYKNVQELSNIEEEMGLLSFGYSKLNSNLNNFSSNISSEDKKVVFKDEKIYLRDGKKVLDLNDNQTISQRKIVPGVYTYEKTTRYNDGSEIVEMDSFAYGLISINTIKPLYKKDEIAEMLIVVLDKWGYLVDDAQITLEITKPSNETILLETSSGQIFKTQKMGVYETSILTDEIGLYQIYAQVELEDMIVDISSFFNVVNSYPFDIIRDVPATIDPWEGPFRNTFQISNVDSNYDDVFNFTEVFSSDFEINETNANIVKTINDTTYLKWVNIDTNFEPYYIAQVPLVTPYLYFLGNSWMDTKINSFYENRSWLFAIDPAAKTCGFNSPCICGAACAGGGEPGDGTIDTCPDSPDYTWEFVNDIRVRSLNGSGNYFGVGDTIEICIDFQTDSTGQGDRITMAYKDGSTSWQNSDILLEAQEDNNNLNTHCTNQVLNNYVGYHHVRGKVVWAWNNRPANLICDTSTSYGEHDDLEFYVLDKVAPTHLSWFLDNGTSTGNNLNVIRSEVINITSLWNLPLQEGRVNHDSTGSSTSYFVDSFSNNQTFYEFDTSNQSLFPNLGLVTINNMTSNDLYFNISGSSTGTRNFNIFAKLKVNQTILNPSVGYSPLNSKMSCQYIDLNLQNIQYSNVNVSFYKNGILMGYNLTNNSGWASYSFSESTIGNYNLTCNVSNDLSNFYLKSSQSESTRPFFVRLNNTDITIPVISNISSSPSLFSIGGVTTLSANVTDDVLVDSVYVTVIIPNSSSYTYLMSNVIGDIYEFDFSLTSQDGNYIYFITAYDNSSNPAYSSTKNFEVSGVRSFIGIQSQQTLFKLGDDLNLTSYNKTQVIDSSIYSEIGDISSIYYSFDSSDEGWTHSGTQDEWERGVPSTGDLGSCDNGNCWNTDLNGNYNSNANNQIFSPIIDMSGRSGATVNFWREIRFASGINDRIFFESFDGFAWNILYQNTVGAHDQEPAFFTYYPSEIDDVSNAQFRFRMTSNGGTNDQGFTFDSFNLSFNPRVDWDKSWNYINSSFGINVSKVTAIKIGFNITNYDSSGSDSLGNPSPDIELQIFNGTDFSSSQFCNLDNTKSYPYYCDFIIKNTPEYVDSWSNTNNRKIRFRVINVDQGDNVTFTDVKREYITPSIVENNGLGVMSAYLLQQFKNSTGGIVSTLYFDPISINPGESKQLTDYWNYSIAGNFQLGNYSAYVALTDALGNVLQNEDDGSYINDSYEFTIQSLIINPITPIDSNVYLESLLVNLSLDTSAYGFGGWCGYSLNGASNVTMNNPSLNYLESNIYNLSDGIHNIQFFCNDSDGDFVNTQVINFNISQSPRISFIPPTDSNNAIVSRFWTLINVSLIDSSYNSSASSLDETNLEAFYSFEDDSLGTFEDLSINSNTLTLIDNTFSSSAAPTINSNYADLDGTGDYMSASDSSSLDLSNNATIMAWVRLDSPSSYWGILQKGSNYRLIVDSSNRIYAQFAGSPLTSTSSIPTGTWTHITATYLDTPTGNDIVKIYINGVEDASGGPQWGTPSTNTNDLYVGSQGTSSYLNGGIDEVRIYSSTLSSTEILNIYNSYPTKSPKTQTWVSWNGTNETIDCSLVSGISHICNINKTPVLNGFYTYRVCANDSIGNVGCTEFRNITIANPVPQITILSPLNGTKFSQDDIINLSILTDIEADLIWYEVNSNGTLYNLTKYSSLNWSSNISLLKRGSHLIDFYARDSIGNINFNSTRIYIIPDKHVFVSKKIRSSGFNNYNVTYNITNLGKWTDYMFGDIVYSNFNKTSTTLNPNSSISLGPNNLELYNLSIPLSNSLVFNSIYSGFNQFKTSNFFSTSID